MSRCNPAHLYRLQKKKKKALTHAYIHWEVSWKVTIWDVSDARGSVEGTCVVSMEEERWCVKARLICLWLALIKVAPGRVANTRGKPAHNRKKQNKPAACYKSARTLSLPVVSCKKFIVHPTSDVCFVCVFLNSYYWSKEKRKCCKTRVNCQINHLFPAVYAVTDVTASLQVAP